MAGDPNSTNTVGCHVTKAGWPYVFMVTDEHIRAGDELLLSYGADFWRKEELMVSMLTGTRDNIPISRLSQ